MYYTGQVQKLQEEIEYCFREYYQARTKLEQLNGQVLGCAREGKLVPDDIVLDISEVDWDINFCKNQLESLKEEYINLIKSIKLPS